MKRKRETADHDVRVWLTASQYVALQALAELDERSVSAYVRRLIAADIADQLPARRGRGASGSEGTERGGEGR